MVIFKHLKHFLNTLYLEIRVTSVISLGYQIYSIQRVVEKALLGHGGAPHN